jgi:hypothetical protein
MAVMTFSKNLKIKKKYGVDFGIIAKEIVQLISMYMVEASKTNLNEDDLRKMILSKTIRMIMDKMDSIDPMNLIEIGKILCDREEEKFDVDNPEDFAKIEALIQDVTEYLASKVESETLAFVELLQEKKF